MAWLWSSWHEYTEWVRPVLVQQAHVLRLAQHDSLFENLSSLRESVDRIAATLAKLGKLGFTGSGHKKIPRDESTLENVKYLVEELIHSGETLLLYHKRLAQSDAAREFLHQHDIFEPNNWERYSKSERIYFEIDRLVKGGNALLSGYDNIVKQDRGFIVDNLKLPEDLEQDFVLARNLFSVGLDEIALLVAGRGLEAVLRKVARVRKVRLRGKNTDVSAHETDFHDLVETIYSLRRKANGARVISTNMRALLHYVRVVRNESAHPASNEFEPTGNSREIASTIVGAANELWKVARTRARFEETTLQKTW